MEIITQSNVMFALGLIGIGYTVIMGIVGPQKKSETNDLLMEQKIDMLNKKNEGKFTLIQTDVANLTRQNQNHIHTIDVKVDELRKDVSDVCKGLVRLETVVKERIPPKT